MPTVKQTRTHDMLQLRMRCQDGSSLLITCSRNGERVTIDPTDFDTSLKISALITHVKRGLDQPGSAIKGFGQMFDLMESDGKRATSIPDFAEEARLALAAPEGLPKPRITRTKTDATVAQYKSGRTHTVTIAFARGESTEVSIGKSSAGTRSDPAIAAIDDRIMNFVLSAKPMGFAPDVTARALVAYAETCPDLTSFARGLGVAIFQTNIP